MFVLFVMDLTGSVMTGARIGDKRSWQRNVKTRKKRRVSRCAQPKRGIKGSVGYPALSRTEGCDTQVFEQGAYALFDGVADRSDAGDVEAVGVVEDPVFVAVAGEDGAGVAASPW